MKRSAGILLFRKSGKSIEVFLAHPGGPFWKNKDEGSWSIPKGEYEDDEDPLAAARREFEEETGTVPDGDFLPLSPVRLKSGKWIHAWALQNDIDAASVRSNTFSLEWPPRSGKRIEVPEIDRAEWFDIETAMQKINPAQQPLITELLQKIKKPLTN